jgi:hypothetical protein
VYRYKHGDSYEGQFLNGAPYGEGKYQYADGSSYQGEFRNLIHLNKHTGLEGSQRLPKCDGWRHGFGVVSICYFDPMRLSWMKGDAINVITAILQFLHIIFCFLSYRAWCFYASTTQQTPQHTAHHSAPTPHQHRTLTHCSARGCPGRATRGSGWRTRCTGPARWRPGRARATRAASATDCGTYCYPLRNPALPCACSALLCSVLFCSTLLCSELFALHCFGARPLNRFCMIIANQCCIVVIIICIVCWVIRFHRCAGVARAKSSSVT